MSNLLKTDVRNVCNSSRILDNIKELYFVTEPAHTDDFDSLWNEFYMLDEHKLNTKKFKKLYNLSFISNDYRKIVTKFQFFDWVYILDLLFLKVLDDAKNGNTDAIIFIENNLFVLFLETFYIKSEDNELEVESLKLLDDNFKKGYQLIDSRDISYSFKDGKLEVYEKSTRYHFTEQNQWNDKVIAHFLESYYQLSLTNKNYLVLFIVLLDLLKSNLYHTYSLEGDHRDINRAIELLKANIFNSQDKRWVEFISEHLRNWWD